MTFPCGDESYHRDAKCTAHCAPAKCAVICQNASDIIWCEKLIDATVITYTDVQVTFPFIDNPALTLTPPTSCAP